MEQHLAAGPPLHESSQFVVLMEDSVPSLQSTVDTFGNSLRKPHFGTDTLPSPKKSIQST